MPATVRPLRPAPVETPPHLHYRLLTLDVEPRGDRILIHCGFGKVRSWTLPVSRYWALTLYLKLGKALGR